MNCKRPIPEEELIAAARVSRTTAVQSLLFQQNALLVKQRKCNIYICRMRKWGLREIRSIAHSVNITGSRGVICSGVGRSLPVEYWMGCSWGAFSGPGRGLTWGGGLSLPDGCLGGVGFGMCGFHNGTISKPRNQQATTMATFPGSPKHSVRADHPKQKRFVFEMSNIVLARGLRNRQDSSMAL